VQEYIIGLDVGGTSIKWSLYELKNGKLSQNAVFQGSDPTGKGIKGFPHSVRDAVKDALKHLNGKGSIVAAGLCTPGRFLPPDFERVAAHTAHRLCLPEAQDAFDNQPLKQILRDSMPSNIPLYVDNDAIVQMLGLLIHTDIDMQIKVGEVAGYIGPGTGLGGGFAVKEAPGVYHSHTDGHINHILLKLNPEDELLIREIEKKQRESFPGRDGMFTAEGILCGPGLELLCGLGTDEARKLDEDSALREKHLTEIKLAGRVMGKLVKTLYNGEFEKLNPADTWPVEDQYLASKARTYLFAGGIGNSKYLGEIILSAAKAELKNAGIEDINFIQCGANPAARAAAEMALGAWLEQQSARQNNRATSSA
jgi:hypothetical protein